MIPATAQRRATTFGGPQPLVVGRPHGRAHLFFGPPPASGRLPIGKRLLCGRAVRSGRPVRVVSEWLTALCSRCALIVARRYPEPHRGNRPAFPIPEPALLEAAIAAATTVEQVDSVDFEASLRGAPMWDPKLGGTPKWMRDQVARRTALRAKPAFPTLPRQRTTRSAARAAEEAIARRLDENRSYRALARTINAQPRTTA